MVCCGVELNFSNTYFQRDSRLIIRIKTDSPVQSLTSAEVPKSAGCSHFSGEFADRFIIWRADGSTIHLDEYSVDRELNNSTVSISFSQSLIIPGSSISINQRIFSLVVPTQSAIYRFYIDLPNKPIAPGQSILHIFSAQDNRRIHEYHQFRTGSIATKASTFVTSNFSTVTIVSLADRQLIRVTFPSFSSNGIEEVALQTGGVFDRLFKKNPTSEILDIAILVDYENEDLFACSFSKDGKIRLYSSVTNAPCFVADITELLPFDPLHSRYTITDSTLKSFPHFEMYNFVVLRLNVANHARFIVLECSAHKLTHKFDFIADTKYVVDFTLTYHGGQTNTVCLWAIFNEEVKENRQDTNAYQSYLLKKYEIPLDAPFQQLTYNWETVRKLTSYWAIDQNLLGYPSCEFIRSRIFDGNSYSFNIVSRALQLVCKHPTQMTYSENWLSLNKFLDEFLSSEKFSNIYLDDNSDPSDFNLLNDDKIKEARERFFKNLLDSCNQLQEADSLAIALWNSDNLNLVGIIQMGRFSIFIPNDQCSHVISTLTSGEDGNLYDIVAPILHLKKESSSSFSNNEATMEKISIKGINFCEAVKAFVHYHKSLFNESFPSQSFEYFGHSLSPFTVELMTTALKERIVERLRMAHVMSKLIAKIPQFIAIPKGTGREEELVAKYDADLVEIVSNYTTIWNILSIRCYTSGPKSNSDQILFSGPKHIDVAQALFKFDYVNELNKDFRFHPSPSSEAEVGQHEQPMIELEEMAENLGQVNEAFEGFIDEEHQQQERKQRQEDGVVDEDDQEKVDGYDAGDIDEDDDEMPPSRWDRTAISMSDDVENRSLGLIDGTAQEAGEDEDIGERQRAISRIGVSPSEGEKLARTSITIGHSTKLYLDKICQTLERTIASICPTSKNLALPKFLFEKGFFDALRHFCYLTEESYIEPLHYSLRFFLGLALSGLNLPNEALRIFDEVIDGIALRDGHLNILLYQLFPSSLQEPSLVRHHSLTEYYFKIMLLFKSHSHSDYVINAGQRAIKNATENDNSLLPEIYVLLFTQHLIVGDYFESMRIVLINPDKSRQIVCLRQLVGHLLEHQQNQVLVDLYYEHLTDDVAIILEARCRSETLSAHSNHLIYDITYSFYVARCEFEKAASIMYELEERLSVLVQNREVFLKRCHILATVLQTMQIVEPGTEIIVPCSMNQESMVADDGNSSEERRPSVFSVSQEEISQRLLKSEARLALIDADPLSIPPIDNEEILKAALKNRLYDMAWIFVWEFDLRPYTIFEAVILEALQIDLESEIASEEQPVDTDEMDWIALNRQFLSETNGNYKIHWRIVISYVDLALKIYPSDSQILRTCTYMFLKYSMKLPTWLQTRYRKRNFGDMIRCLIDFGELEDAFSVLLKEIEMDAKQQVDRSAIEQIRDRPTTRAISGATQYILPYTHIDELLYLAKNSGDTNKMAVEKTLVKIEEFFNVQKKWNDDYSKSSFNYIDRISHAHIL